MFDVHHLPSYVLPHVLVLHGRHMATRIGCSSNFIYFLIYILLGTLLLSCTTISFLLRLTIFTTLTILSHYFLTILSVYIALIPICVITLWLCSQTTCYNILAMHNILYAWLSIVFSLSIAFSLIPYGTDFWG